MLNKIVTYTFFPLLILVMLFLYGFASERNHNKKVTNIEVEFTGGDNLFLTHNLVDKLLIQNQKEVKNLQKRVLDLHKLENTLLANPYIEKANVFITPEGLLKTSIKQREPLARIITKEENYYVDKYGVKIPLSANYSARVPLVTGVSSLKDIKEITKLVTLFSEDDFLKKEIVSVKKTLEKEYIFGVRSGSYKIVFGKYTNVDEKVKKIKAFYNKALLDKTIHNYTNINVKYHNQVVCTKQNQDGKQ